MRSVGSVLDESRGLGKGFDFLRVALAVAVVTWHTPIIARMNVAFAENSFFRIIGIAILPMFFALSGFLIAGSAQRLGLKDFLINRSLRIFPALTVEILLSALIIGPVFTSLPLEKYFLSYQTWHYLTNLVGLINYHLPGLFNKLPVDVVNGSLWTVPFEMGCYTVMALLIYYRLIARPWVAFVLVAAVLGAGMLMFYLGYHSPPHGHLERRLDPLFYGRGSPLLVYFLLGISSYAYRHKIPYSRRIFATMSGVMILAGAYGFFGWPNPAITAILLVPLTYILIFLGVSRLPVLPFFDTGDYSYGIYLYGWPVMQMVRALFPRLGAHGPFLLAASLPVIVIFATLSWHFIEKPILRLRKNFSFVARQRLAENGRGPGYTKANGDDVSIIRQSAP